MYRKIIPLIVGPFLLILLVSADVSKDSRKIYFEEDICISPQEYRLFLLINKYRRDNGLVGLEISRALTYVSQLHAWDLAINNPVNERCNLHSWSGKDFWRKCCYHDNHSNAECMWFKPRELTGYPGIGYEVVFYSTYPEDKFDFPEAALDGWKSSSSHNDILLNRRNWGKVKLRTMGVGIYSSYAVVWFGTEEDADGKPLKCD